MTYKLGDNWVLSDRSGRKIYASESRREWDGTIVHKSEYFGRQPQDYVKGVRDVQRVAISRPRPVDTFGGPLTTYVTADAVAGAVVLEVASSVRMESGDQLAIMLDNGDRHLAIIQDVNDATHVQVTPATKLPWAVSIGKAVIDMSAVTAADLG